MDKTVGILGGGQLGRMIISSANLLGVKAVVLEESEDCAANQINSGAYIKGSFKDPKAVKELANQVDVVTIEIEHINVDALEALADGDQRVIVQPHPSTIRTIQDKFAQKEYLIKRGIPVAKQVAVNQVGDADSVEQAVESVGGYPVMLKARKDAYDGRGNFALKSKSQISEAIETLHGRSLYVEAWAKFKLELAVMVVKTEDKPDADWTTSTLAYPCVETVHEDSICKLVYCPPRKVDQKTQDRAQEFARKAVAGFRGKGVFGVEMFLLDSGEILINEIAPRVHNSGHHTIEACGMSQFESHLRAILDVPIDPISLKADRAAIMLNILGCDTPTRHLEIRDAAAKIPRAAIHLYGKAGRPSRKVGHVTITADTLAEAEERIQPLVDLVDRLRAERLASKTASSSAMKQQVVAKVPATSTTSSTNESTGTARVAITMGSDSDRGVLESGAALLRKFGIPYESNITSAHRTPDRMIQFAEQAAGRGIQVIIAAAGGMCNCQSATSLCAAHLPGMIASSTSLPVIGVPVKATHLDGLDSLLSIVQMPKGVPTATVGINNSINAALLAIRILALNDAEIKKKLDTYIQSQTDEVLVKAEKMQQHGIEGYKPAPAS